MLKHRGFPGRMPGTDFQFTIRRANVKVAEISFPQVFHPEPDAPPLADWDDDDWDEDE